MPRPTRTPIGLVLAGTAKVVGRAFDDALIDAGGSRPTWLILMALKTRPDANQREVAEAIGIRGATLTHHLDAMERDGLLTRRRDPTNRRMHRVELTDRGEAAFLQLASVVSAFDRRLRRGLGEQEIAQLEDLLARLQANADPGRS